MITVENLTRRFGPVVAVEDLTFQIGRGEVVGFLGPNGAGKTTTMRILAGFLPATRGRAQVAGFDVVAQSLEVRRRIGYLPETVPLYGEMRVQEMLVFQARLHGLGRSRMRRRIPEVLERVGIRDRSRQLIAQLSKGLQQRVGLAVALLPSPEVLILDEPTSGLDPLQRIEVRALLAEFAREHTVLLSSHILPEVEAICPRVIILQRGRIAADGTPSELVRRLGERSYVRVEAFLGGDSAAAERLLGAIPGALEVRERGRRGIHHEFEIRCDQDLREDVGALASQRGWALRELSWRAPSLEELFARIALDLELEGPTRTGAEADDPATVASTGDGDVVAEWQTSRTSPQGSSGTAALSPFEKNPAPRRAYNLNPFEARSPPPVESGRPPGRASQGPGEIG